MTPSSNKRRPDGSSSGTKAAGRRNVKPSVDAQPNSLVGQLMIIGFDGVEITPRLASLLTRVDPAGVILFTRNIKSAAQTWRLLRDCQDCVSKPLFTCIDLEGGAVDRLREVVGPAPSAADVFASGDRGLFRRHGEMLGASCRAFGFNVDFAPVFDLAFEASRSVLGSRAVSQDPAGATAYAGEFLSGLFAARVLGCGKHFPGLGEGTLDSHHKLPVIDKTFDQLWSEDLVPYRQLRNRLPFVMVAHAAYPPVTKNRTPASLSKKWITDILRRKIGYRGLIVSDDLEMGGVLASASVGEAAVGFVRAGGDLCLVCHREDRVAEAYESLKVAARNDQEFAQRAAESGRRVAAFKKKFAPMLRWGKQPSPSRIELLSRDLWEFGERVRLEPLARAEDRRQRRMERT